MVAGDTLFVHLFTGATLAASLAGGELAVRVDTGYPWSGTAEIRVTTAPSGPAGLAVRVPAWSPHPRLVLNGEPVAGESVGGVPGAEPAVAARRCAAV